MTLPLIAAYDQLAAALEQLRPQVAFLLQVLTRFPEQRGRLTKAYDDIEAAVTLIDELLAFERSDES